MQHVGRRGLGEVDVMQSTIRGTVVGLVAALSLGLPAAGGAAPRHEARALSDVWRSDVRRAPLSELRVGKKRVRMPADYSAWTRVSQCESGGWQVLGSSSGPYPDALGIDRANWLAAGGNPEPHGPVPLARRVYEIKIADRFIRAYGIGVPDQYRCAAW